MFWFLNMPAFEVLELCSVLNLYGFSSQGRTAISEITNEMTFSVLKSDFCDLSASYVLSLRLAFHLWMNFIRFISSKITLN